ncbi:MAG: LysM peptidoglycan-binding domain-containing protein [Deltaproteobacteria bacterium]|nr:LysM peptidoglycan-binding domain-containing protein [Deltaproteobacteria bacterium]
MHRRHVGGCLFTIAMLIVPSLALSAVKEPAKEDTAHISLQKTAATKNKTKVYRVKKGDSITKIMQGMPGPTEHRYTRVKELNPRLKDINMIYPGQLIILPAEDSSEKTKEAGSPYLTRKGDSITRIIIRTLSVKNSVDVLKITKQITTLNPQIKNPDRIYPGQIIMLPEKEIAERGEDAVIPAQEEAVVAETEPLAENKTAEEEQPAAIQEKRLAVIGHVIKQMNGSFISTGSYYLPLPETGNVAIDCTAIPVAELNDGSTILIDFARRLPESMWKIIQMNWKNYSLVRPSPREDTAATLQKIINCSREYTIAKLGKPLLIGNNSRIQISPDWMITRKTPTGDSPYRQGLFFLSDLSQQLPRPLIRYAGKNGLIITEIVEGTGIANRQDGDSAFSEIPGISGASPLDITYNLLSFLGYQPTRDADVNIFDTAKDGFNLTIKAGLLLKSGDRRIVFHSKKLPQQFLDILKEGKTEVTVLADNEARRSVIEKTLRAMNIPFSSDNFSFSIPGKADKAPATVSFPALKAEREQGSLYLINFALDRDIQELLRTRWGMEIVTY